MFANRRLHKRHTVKAVATVFYGSNMLELPIRDISLTGIGLDADDATTLTVGNLCFVSLPEHGKLDAMVVGVRRQSYHLQFLTSEPDEVRSFIDAHSDGAAS
ncbi:MAG: PilZ domain-containing protein [Pseudomonadota bacterium]